MHYPKRVNTAWGRRAAVAIVVFGVLVALAVSTHAKTPQIRDNARRPVAGSIAVMEKIELGGIQQWVVIRGHDSTAPVLLWLADGPGGSELGWTRRYLSDLEADVVFVNWEQPGSGKSAAAADIRELTVEHFVDQTILISEYLAARFHKKRILLVGHGWGSVIGLLAAGRRPELYYAYVGVAQRVNTVENDRIGYELVLSAALRAGDTSTVGKLTEQGSPPYSIGRRGAYFTLFRWLSRYSPAASDNPEAEFLAAVRPPEYTLCESVAMIHRMMDGIDFIYPQLAELDFEKQVPSFDVPLYLVSGRHDRTCLAEISYRYFQTVTAPGKRFYWFDRSGHNACFQEPGRFVDIVRRDVLPLCTVEPLSVAAPGPTR